MDCRPEVQAYLKEVGDPKHYLEPVGIWAAAGGVGVFVDEVLALAPAAAPSAYYLADKIYKFGQTFWGKLAGDALEGAAEGCLEADCSPESVVAGAVEGAAFGTLETWGRPKNLSRHFKDHGADFGAESADEYAQMAAEFFLRSQREGLPTKVDTDGVIRTYNPNSNTFGAYNPDGTTKTFFKPTSPTYWDRQLGSPPTIIGEGN